MSPDEFEKLSDDEKHAYLAAAQTQKEALLSLAREDFNTFAEYVLKDEQTGNPILQGWVHEKWGELFDAHKNVLIIASVELGKALPVETPVATPSGWVPIGDLRTGDTVIGSDGKPCTVTFATPPTQLDMWELSFDDGSSVVACADHLWKAQSTCDRHDNKGETFSVVSTAEIVSTLRIGQFNNWSLPVCSPVEFAEKKLPIDPYVLGAWLGDGCSRRGTVYASKKDYSVIEECTRRGAWPNQSIIEDRPGFYKATFCEKPVPGHRGGLTSLLNEQGLIQNKHIPEVYLTASIQQRKDLLAGLMDTDGYVSRQGPQLEFTSVKKPLAKDVLELVRSLGYKARIHVGRASTNGKDCGEKYRVQWTARDQIFYSPRKHQIHTESVLKKKDNQTARRRYIVSARKVESAVARCIGVDNADKTYICNRDYTVTHNSVQLSVARTLFELGRNPRLRVAIISRTFDQAVKLTRLCARYIEESDALHEVFPDLRPGPRWTDRGLFVKGAVEAKDPSLRPLGIGGAITGARLDLIIMDDVLDRDNTNTEDANDKVFDWFWAMPMTRLTKQGKVVIIGNAWTSDDLYSRLQKRGWPCYKFPIVATPEFLEQFPEARTPVDQGGPGLQEGLPIWPENWPLERVAQRKEMTPPLEFARAYMCMVRDDADARFRAEWVQSALDKGEGMPVFGNIDDFFKWYDDHEKRGSDEEVAEDVLEMLEGSERFQMFTGVDLSTGKGKDLTALVTIALHVRTKQRYLLRVDAGRWQVDEILKRITSTHHAFQSICIVENVFGQDFIVQLLQNQGNIPVVPMTTGKAKADPLFGVEVLASELNNGIWVFPARGGVAYDVQVEALCNEMLYYLPDEHTGDRLMALWFAQVLAKKMERHRESSVECVFL